MSNYKETHNEKKTPNVMPINEAKRHFSDLEELIKQTGEVIITKNNEPMYVMFDIQKMGQDFLIEYEALKVKFLSNQLIEEYEEAYHKLAD